MRSVPTTTYNLNNCLTLHLHREPHQRYMRPNFDKKRADANATAYLFDGISLTAAYAFREPALDDAEAHNTKVEPTTQLKLEVGPTIVHFQLTWADIQLQTTNEIHVALLKAFGEQAKAGPAETVIYKDERVVVANKRTLRSNSIHVHFWVN